jgi:membrane protein DedA with SNARE-associated domain/rhodanese-related sulfurtransferase
MVPMIVKHAEWILFVWILANQVGVPIPVVPVLVGVGVWAGNGSLNLPVALAVAVGAALSADFAWYGLGRWQGSRALDILSRLSPGTKAYVHHAEQVFLAHEGGALPFSARFLPELNFVAAGLAGAFGVSTIHFLPRATVSAVLWAGTWTSVGYLVSYLDAGLAHRLGIPVTLVVFSTFVMCVLVRRAQRQRVVRTLRMARIRADELQERLQDGGTVTVLDVRAPIEVAAAPYAVPGALRITPDELARRSHEIPRHAEVVMYGAAGQAAGGLAALALRSAGIRRVRPLIGGVRGWRKRGFPVEPVGGGWGRHCREHRQDQRHAHQPSRQGLRP